MAKENHLIVVGKLKDSHLEAIEKNYLQRLSFPPLKVHEVKARAENKAEEAKAILKRIEEIKGSSAYLVALTENGKNFNSVAFSHWLYQDLQYYQNIIFVIAGAEGFDREILSKFNIKLSLSPLTFPHKIARIVLIEQLYRAQTIAQKHPYHN